MAQLETSLLLRLKDQLSAPARAVRASLRGIRDAAKATARESKAAFQGVKEAGEKAKAGFKFAADLNQAAEGAQRFDGMARGLVEGPLELAANFEAQGDRVRAITKSTTEEFAEQRRVALQLGESTRYSATQAFEGMEMLAVAGFDAGKQIAALPAVLDLATAGATDLGRTAEISSNIMGGFGIEATKMSWAADVLSATFTSSNTTLESLGNTMEYVGPVAKAAGQEFEVMSAAAGLLGNAGLQGEKGGTALRAMLTRLTKPAGEAGKALKRLKLDPVDKETGQLRQLPDILAEINEKTKDMGEAERLKILGELFGQEALAASAQLLTETASGAFDDYITKLKDVEGENRRIAQEMSSNTKGSAVALSSAFEGLSIAVGDLLLPVLSDLIADAKSWVADAKSWVAENRELATTLGKAAIKIAVVGSVMAPVLVASSALVSSITLLRLGFRSSIAVLSPFGKALVWAAVKMKVLDASALSTKMSLSGFRGALNAGALGTSINGVTGKLGQAGLLGAALGVGYAFGSWLDHKFGISEMVAEWLTDFRGLHQYLVDFGEFWGIDSVAEIGRGALQGQKNRAAQAERDKEAKTLDYEKDGANIKASLLEQQGTEQASAVAKATADALEQHLPKGKVKVDISVDPEGRPRVKQANATRGVEADISLGRTLATP